MRRHSFLAIVPILAATILPARAATPDLLHGEALLAAARTGRPVSIEAGTLGRVSLRLWPNPIHAPGARFTKTGAGGMRRDVRPEPFWTLAGEVAGVAGSVVRLTATPNWVSGFISVPGREVWIQPDDYDRPGSTVFSEPMLTPAAGPGVQDVTLSPSGGPAASHGDSDVNIYGIGNCVLVTCGELEALIVLDADVFYNNLSSTTCFARQATTLNNVDAIYKLAATRIDLTITAQNCRESADLGGTSTGALDYIEALRNAWLNEGDDRSIVFLFVGYDMAANAPTGTIGVAYEAPNDGGGVCERMEPDPLLVIDWDQKCAWGYALAQMVGRRGGNYTATEFLKTKLMAHEIGHNFSATHDSATGCSTSAYAGDLMCAYLQVNGPNTFSSASAQLIRSHAERTIGYAWQL